MHSVVVTKVEYRLIEDENFSTPFDIVPESGRLTEEPGRTSQGILNKASAEFSIAGITADSDTLMKKLSRRKHQFRLTDSNGCVHLVGDDYYHVRFSYQKIIDQTPGTFNGYRCSIACNSPSGSSVS